MNGKYAFECILSLSRLFEKLSGQTYPHKIKKV